MAKREQCELDENPSWTGLYLGDCGQHLKLGECPAINGIEITHSGASYYSPPLAIISGDTGGGNAFGFLGYGTLDSHGFVNGLQIKSHGWHFTQRPTIVFSGEFHSGRDDSNNIDCSGKPWDYYRCSASGLGTILGYKIYENKTLLYPQCSVAYTTGNWWGHLKSGHWINECAPEDLALIGTDRRGRCTTPVGLRSGLCVTTFESGWTDDCTEGTWEKSENRCDIKGSAARRPQCVGNWYDGGHSAVCGPAIPQKWAETDQYLDFGTCKKRGYKNVVAYKCWHGAPPFNVKYQCTPQEEGDVAYDRKYLDADAFWNYQADYYNGGTCCVGHKGDISSSLLMKSRVGRYDGRITITQEYWHDSTNFGEGPRIEQQAFQGFERCTPSYFGYSGQDEDPQDPDDPLPGPGEASYLWNKCIVQESEFDNDGAEGQEFCVTTHFNIDRESGLYLTFVQDIVDFQWKRVYDCGELIDGICVGGHYELQHDYHFHSVESITIHLGNPYTYQELNDDADILLNKWNLLDDTIYPWKTTEGFKVLPKVTYCEGTTSSPIQGLYPVFTVDCSKNISLCNYSFTAYGATITWDDCHPRPDWPKPADGGFAVEGSANLSTREVMKVACHQTINTPLCVANCMADGHIVGGPSTVGHFGSIDLNRANIEDVCCSCTCDTMNNYLTVSFGGQSPLYHITQWPNTREEKLLYFGAFASINDWSQSAYDCSTNQAIPLIPADTLTKTKYAEIIQMDKPSRNFRMPCGIGSCEDWTLINDHDEIMLTAAARQVGTAYSGNCATVCKCGNTSEGGKSCEACSGEETQKERWPQLSNMASACSTVLAVVSGASYGEFGAVNELDAVFNNTLEEVVEGQYVNAYLTFNSGPTSLGAYCITDVLHASGIRLSGSFPISTTDIAGWVDFANDEDYFDNTPKGDFVIRKWNFPSFAGEGTTWRHDSISPFLTEQTTYSACVPWSPCDPSIAIIAPENSIENQTKDAYNRNVYIYDMPDLVPQPWGSRYHYIIQQWMQDPIWVPPSTPCCLLDDKNPDRPACQSDEEEDEEPLAPTDVRHTWEEDDGTCLDKVDEYSYGFGGSISMTTRHFYPMRPFVEARTTSLGTFVLPSNTCAYPSPSMISWTKACLSLAELNAMDTGIFYMVQQLYGDTMSVICAAPVAGYDYWDKHAPWLVSANQQACLDEAYPRTDTNPIGGNLI